MKLTKRNYYTNTKYITNSRITDWLKDKNFFYRKNVLREVEDKMTDAMLLGKAVDVWLTDSEKSFRGQFIPVSRRNLKEPPVGYYEMSQALFDKAVAICQKIEQQQVMKELKGFNRQKILQKEMPLGLFEGIAGIPDWFRVFPEEKLAVIVDLKTAPSIDPRRYHFHCLEYNYYRQQAMYQILVKENYPEVENYNSFHIVVEKDGDDIYNVAVFQLYQGLIDKEKIKIKSILYDISQERKFLPRDVKFSDAILIGKQDDLLEETYEDE
jgi:hypothetical protein